MTPHEMSEHAADGALEQRDTPAVATPIGPEAEASSEAASEVATESGAAAALTGAIAMVDLPVAKVISQAVARKRLREQASASALEVELRLKGAKIHRAVTKKDRVQRGARAGRCEAAALLQGVHRAHRAARGRDARSGHWRGRARCT